MELNVSMACAVPLAGSVNAARVQVISSEDEAPQVDDDERPPEPVRPPWLVKVNVVDADWPGAEIVTDVGLAVIVNVGPGVTVSPIAEEVEAA